MEPESSGGFSRSYKALNTNEEVTTAPESRETTQLSKVRVLIPSKDRASQLDLLLLTMSAFYPELEPVVLWKASNANYECGYLRVMQLHPDVTFEKEEDFYGQFRLFVLQSPGAFGLFTDDCIIFRRSGPISLQLIEWSLSLRLGFNTVVQDYKTQRQQRPLVPDYQKVGSTDFNKDRVLFWDWKKYSQSENYGFPFSWDGCFYRTDRFLDAIAGANFTQTDNQWACPAQIVENWINNRAKMPWDLSCFEYSSVVCQNINDTHGFSQPGIRFSAKLHDLNEAFLAGYRIDFSSLDFSSVNACHMEIPFSLMKGE